MYFYRHTNGHCNTGGTYPPVNHHADSREPTCVFPGRHSAKICSFCNVLANFLQLLAIFCNITCVYTFYMTLHVTYTRVMDACHVYTPSPHVACLFAPLVGTFWLRCTVHTNDAAPTCLFYCQHTCTHVLARVHICQHVHRAHPVLSNDIYDSQESFDQLFVHVWY